MDIDDVLGEISSAGSASDAESEYLPAKGETATEAQVECCGPFLPRVYWEENASHCGLCEKRFKPLYRHWHHCRRCGKLVCKRCSPCRDCCGVRICTECVSSNSPTRNTKAVTATSGYAKASLYQASVRPHHNHFRWTALKVVGGLRTFSEMTVYETWVFRKALRTLRMGRVHVAVSSDTDSDALDHTTDHLQSDNDSFSVGSDISMLPDGQLDDDGINFSYNLTLPILESEQLRKLVQKLYNAGLPSFNEAYAIFVDAERHLSKLDNVINLQVPEDGHVIIVGDLHGQLNDLKCILESRGGPSDSTYFVFNGDFVDRGRHGLEVFLILCAFLLMFPNSVFLNRGNHECDAVNRTYGFFAEVMHKYEASQQMLYEQVQRVFACLPLVYVINASIVVVHAGLSYEPDVTLKEIQALDRKSLARAMSQNRISSKTRAERIYEALLWSDPMDFPDGSSWAPSERGAGIIFGEGLVSNFLKLNKLKGLVRSHQVFSAGYCTHHGGMTTTTFSASNYCGTDNNRGCHIVVHPSLRLEFCQHSVLPVCDETKQDTEMHRHNIPFCQPGDVDWHRNAKTECLNRLSFAIFSKRHSLTQCFQEFDENRVGTVDLTQWVHACQACIHRRLPWYALSRYFIVLEPDGAVAYAAFLDRFQCPTARRLMFKWAAKLLPYVCQRIGQSLEYLTQLSYTGLCAIMRQEIPGLNEQSVYYMFLSLRRGRRTPWLQTPAQADLHVDQKKWGPCAVDLWVMYAFYPDKWHQFRIGWQVLSDNEQPDTLQKDAFISLAMRSCRQVGGEARQLWEATADSLSACDKASGIAWRTVGDSIQYMHLEWSCASLMLDIIDAAARSGISLRQLFRSYDSAGVDKLKPIQLFYAVREWVGWTFSSDEGLNLFKALDVDKDGFVGLAEFVSTLEIVDTWASAIPEHHRNILPKGAASNLLVAISQRHFTGQVAFSQRSTGRDVTWPSALKKDRGDVEAPSEVCSKADNGRI